jgi:hypothetical protein
MWREGLSGDARESHTLTSLGHPIAGAFSLLQVSLIMPPIERRQF